MTGPALLAAARGALGRPGVRQLALAGAASAVALLAGGELGTTAAAATLLLALAAGAVAILARRAGRGPSAPAPLEVLGRAPLGKDSGVAIVACGRERLVVGWGSSGVALLGRAPEEAP